MLFSRPVNSNSILGGYVIENLACNQVSEKSKRIFCSWRSVSAVTHFVVFLMDAMNNVMEKIEVKESHGSFHGRLLMYNKPFNVLIGQNRHRLILRGTSVV